MSFNQLDDRTMSRIRHQKVSEDTGEEVPAGQIVEGEEISKDRYVIVDPDELARFVPLATKSIDLEEFVELADIDPMYFETSYYVAPSGNPKPYALLARALRRTGKVAIARFVIRSRQCTAALRAVDGRLVLSTLAYADEIVPAGSVDELAGLDDVEVSSREVTMAEMLVDSLTAEFDPTKYEHVYRVQVLDLIARKAAGEEFELPPRVGEEPKIVDMMAALEASAEAAKAARQRYPAARAAPSKKQAAPAKRQRKSA